MSAFLFLAAFVVAALGACKTASKDYALTDFSSTLSINLDQVQAFAAVRVVFDDSYDRSKLRVEASGPDDLMLDVVKGTFDSEVKITAKSASFVGTTANTAVTTNGGGEGSSTTTASGGGVTTTNANNTATMTTSGRSGSIGERLQNNVLCGIVSAATYVATESSASALSSLVLCASASGSSFVRADDCYLKVTITMSTQFGQSRFTSAASTVAVSCSFAPSAIFMAKAVDVKGFYLLLLFH